MESTIAYVTQFFPILTETFVYREVVALRARGYRVATFANRTPDVDKLSAESLDFIDSTTYVFPLRWFAFIAAHLYFLLYHPQRYLQTFWYIISPRGESWRNRIRTFGHFCGGVFLARAAGEQGVSHVHAHFTVNAATIGLVMARLLDVSYSFTVHNNIFTDRLILRQKLASARFIISISEFSRDYLLRYAPEQHHLAAKIHIVHCGISADQFDPLFSSLDRQHTVRSAKPRILSLSALAERKGIPILIDACRLLRERGVDFECVIAGDGPQRTLIQKMIDDYGLRDIVTMSGRYFQEEITDYLSAADLFVLPCLTSHNGDMDGIPVALMEAMAMEVPTISTWVSGIPELIDDGHSGLLVPERNAQRLADAIEQLLHDEQLATFLARNGRQRVLADFNIDCTTEQLIAHFENYVFDQRSRDPLPIVPKG